MIVSDSNKVRIDYSNWTLPFFDLYIILIHAHVVVTLFMYEQRELQMLLANCVVHFTK